MLFNEYNSWITAPGKFQFATKPEIDTPIEKEPEDTTPGSKKPPTK